MNLDKKISIILLIILIAAVAGVIYIIINPNPGEKFTEFYILGPDGKAGNYPTNLTVGQTGNVIVGVINHEQATTTYNLIVKLNNNTLKNENITLSNNEKKEIPFSFTAVKGSNQKVDFLLYKMPDNSTIYRSLYLDVNVS
ncbi:MAG TPA: DUF1616 domain-containing protein [Methanobacterium sp.]|nr:DUF1616 domain-containing protein [Methanobacterium sp.]